MSDYPREPTAITRWTADDLTDHVQAMLQRAPVLVLVDMHNGAGEVTKRSGWRTLIREIRRPALPEHEAAYGHLDPVIVVEGDPDDPDWGRSISICLRPVDIVRDPWCGCSDPNYCRGVSASYQRALRAARSGRSDR